MSLKSHLETRETLELVARSSWQFGRRDVIASGMAWYDAHPEEAAIVGRNLEHMGLDSSPAALRRSLEGIVTHYFEKFFVMTKGFEAHWIVEKRVEVGGALAPLERARREGRAVFLGQSHFGGTYLLVPILITHGFDVTFIGLFPGRVFEMLKANIDAYSSRWKTGRATLVNIADADAPVPEIMMGAFASGEIVMNVFDENNALSRPVRLLGRTLHGGSGMDRILSRYSEDRVSVLAPFAVRTSTDSFRLEMDRLSLSSKDIVQDLFDSLGRRIAAASDQWYFIQELHHSLGPAGPRPPAGRPPGG